MKRIITIADEANASLISGVFTRILGEGQFQAVQNDTGAFGVMWEIPTSPATMGKYHILEVELNGLLDAGIVKYENVFSKDAGNPLAEILESSIRVNTSADKVPELLKLIEDLKLPMNKVITIDSPISVDLPGFYNKSVLILNIDADLRQRLQLAVVSKGVGKSIAVKMQNAGHIGRAITNTVLDEVVYNGIEIAGNVIGDVGAGLANSAVHGAMHAVGNFMDKQEIVYEVFQSDASAKFARGWSKTASQLKDVAGNMLKTKGGNTLTW